MQDRSPETRRRMKAPPKGELLRSLKGGDGIQMNDPSVSNEIAAQEIKAFTLCNRKPKGNQLGNWPWNTRPKTQRWGVS